MRHCKHRRAEIAVMRTDKNLRMPVNPTRVAVTRVPETKVAEAVTIVTPDGDTLRGYALSSEKRRHNGVVVGFVPHWVTCPRSSDGAQALLF